MDLSILKVLGQVAGLSGLSIGFVLLIFRDVIRKNVFSTLTKEHSYRILILILVLTWSVGIFGILAWLYSSTQTAARPADKKDVQSSPTAQVPEQTEAPTPSNSPNDKAKINKRSIHVAHVPARDHSGAAGSLSQGPCSVSQIGGNNNSATVNCVPSLWKLNQTNLANLSAAFAKGYHPSCVISVASDSDSKDLAVQLCKAAGGRNVISCTGPGMGDSISPLENAAANDEIHGLGCYADNAQDSSLIGTMASLGSVGLRCEYRGTTFSTGGAGFCVGGTGTVLVVGNMPAKMQTHSLSPPMGNTSQLKGVNIDCSGVPGCVPVQGRTGTPPQPTSAASNSQTCNLDNVTIKGYGNNSWGLDTRGGLRVCHTTFDPGSGETQYVDPSKVQPMTAAQNSAPADKDHSEHSVSVVVRGNGLTQEEANHIVSDAVSQFVKQTGKMPNNTELEKQLGENSGKIWANVDCEAHGTGIMNSGNSTFEDVTINQTSCDTGIDNSGNGAVFKVVHITISNRIATAH